MKTKRSSALPIQVDLEGLPAAKLRTLLLALYPPEAAEVFDAQLADLHAEWLAAREHSGALRTAWLGLCIRANLLTGAAYYFGTALGGRALKLSMAIGLGGAITLGLFYGIATLIRPQLLPPPIRTVPLLPDFTMSSKLIHSPDLSEPHPVRPPRPPTNPDERGIAIPPAPPREERDLGEPPQRPFEIAEPGGPPTVEPRATLGNNFLCLPMVRREPEYPEFARRRRIEGNVLVEVAIDPDGSVGSAQILGADPVGVFDDAVLRAVRRWRYKVSGDGPEAGCERTQVRLRFELPPNGR